MVPIRPEGYDWDYPVPGNSKDTEWQGFHPHEDLVQIQNPESGFMQNCNISPGTMMPNSPLTADKYPEYVYNDTQNRSNPRGRSAVRLLSNEENMTVERAKEIALNTSVDRVQIWQHALQMAYKTNPGSGNKLKEAVELILTWNGKLDAENNAAALYRFWRRECRKASVKFTTNEDDTIKEFFRNDQKNMLSALQGAIDYLNEKFGSFKVAWGETVRLKRGDKTWSVSGGAFENGLSVLRAADGRLSLETGVTTVTSGQACCMLVVLKDPIQSFSILPWGESDDPESPHYNDQAEQLFSKSKFKSTYFNIEELLNNLESQKEIVVPEIKIE
jgi:acyl-homoserine lactone acylase PvdQ